MIVMNKDGIKALRLSHQETQDAFAAHFCEARCTVNRWEMGISRPLPVYAPIFETLKKSNKSTAKEQRQGDNKGVRRAPIKGEVTEPRRRKGT